MTTITTASSPTPSTTGAQFTADIRAEWAKLRSARSTTWTLLATFAIAVGFGAILRRTAGAVAALVGVLVLTPLVSGFLAGSFQQSVGKYLPAQAGMSVFGVTPDPNALWSWVGYGVLLVCVAVAFAVGAVLLLRLDA